MPNYIAITKNKIIDLGFFVCDMEADDYASNILNNQYKIIEVADYFDHTVNQLEQQNIMG